MLIVGVPCLLCSLAVPGIWGLLRVTLIISVARASQLLCASKISCSGSTMGAVDQVDTHQLLLEISKEIGMKRVLEDLQK